MSLDLIQKESYFSFREGGEGGTYFSNKFYIEQKSDCTWFYILKAIICL